MSYCKKSVKKENYFNGKSRGKGKAMPYRQHNNALFIHLQIYNNKGKKLHLQETKVNKG